MGTCLNLNLPEPPQLPPIFVPSINITPTIDFGTVGVTCCHYKLPAFSAPIAVPIPPALLIPLITAMNLLIKSALPTLDSIQIPTCPMDGSAVSEII